MEERRGARSKLCNKMLCYHHVVYRIKIQVYRYANESSQKRSQHEADRFSLSFDTGMTSLRHAAPNANAARMCMRAASLSAYARGRPMARTEDV